MAWGSGLRPAPSAPQTPENARRQQSTRPLAHNQHRRSLLDDGARRRHTPARPTNDSHTPALAGQWTHTVIPVSLVGYYPACGRSTWRRPSAIRLGTRMPEGCIPALGMGVDRRAFWPFLVRLRGLGSGNNATPPALPLSCQLPLWDDTTPVNVVMTAPKPTKTSPADADELAHSPPMPVAGGQRGCQLIFGRRTQHVRLARALSTRCAEIWL